MAHTVFCVKLKKELPGLDEPPFDNDLGRKIYDNVSKPAWQMWTEHCKMLLNEYRLNPARREDQEVIVKQLDQFFFGEGSTLPKEDVPPKEGSAALVELRAKVCPVTGSPQQGGRTHRSVRVILGQKGRVGGSLPQERRSPQKQGQPGDYHAVFDVESEEGECPRVPVNGNAPRQKQKHHDAQKQGRGSRHHQACLARGVRALR